MGILLLSVPGIARAQDASIHGIVTDRTSGAALDGATVTLKGANDSVAVRGSLTDVNGFYQIGGVPPGTYTLRVERIGYVTHEQAVTFRARQLLVVSLGLEPSPVALEGLRVEATAGAGAVERDFGRLRVQPVEIARIPAPSASGDLATYLQTLPGVVTAGDRGGQLFIRGGTPDQNLVLIDGLPIYQPFHILGYFSVFPEDLVSSVDFYASGFGPRYVGRTGSVIDVRMREGDRTGFRASGAISPFLAEAVAEGPIGGGQGAWIASARQSLIDLTSRTLLGHREPLSFESQFVKVALGRDSGARCSAMAVRSADRGGLDPEHTESRVAWTNVVLGGRCITLFDYSWLRLADITFGFTRFENQAVSLGVENLTSSVSNLHHEAHVTTLWGTTPIYTGITANAEIPEYDLGELFRLQGRANVIFTASAYLETELAPQANVTLRPGLAFTLLPRPGMEPRLRARWRPWGRDTDELSAALGLYRQDLVGISDTRDVSSVFTAWKDVGNEPPLQAVHASLGWQQSLGEDLKWSIEGYAKWLKDIPVAAWQAAAQYTTDLTRADGRVRGADLRLEYQRPGLYAFLGYGYTWTQYRSSQWQFGDWFGDPVQRYHPPHDRRHQLNAVLTMDVGEFSLAARWQFGSGLPFSRPLGFDEAFDYRTDLPIVKWALGSTRLVLDRPYQARLPAMHRLDLSVRRPFDLPFGQLEAQAGVLNAYDRNNLFYYDLYTANRVDQLPILPYLSFKLKVP